MMLSACGATLAWASEVEILMWTIGVMPESSSLVHEDSIQILAAQSIYFFFSTRPVSESA